MQNTGHRECAREAEAPVSRHQAPVRARDGEVRWFGQEHGAFLNSADKSIGPPSMGLGICQSSRAEDCQAPGQGLTFTESWKTFYSSGVDFISDCDRFKKDYLEFAEVALSLAGAQTILSQGMRKTSSGKRVFFVFRNRADRDAFKKLLAQCAKCA